MRIIHTVGHVGFPSFSILVNRSAGYIAYVTFTSKVLNNHQFVLITFFVNFQKGLR